ncbi:YqaJ viral recombinase family protein [Sulfitobacter dubius]|uniref:YqaJ viral recombinase family protein n=1 Tax=Sulfitobacter dubius TaxID=218673 RepID=UPI0030D74B95
MTTSSALPGWLPSAVAERLRVYTGRDEWLTARQARIAAGGIGSTTAGALLGLSPWRTPWDVWAAVHAPQLLDDNPADPRLLARGLALEPLADLLYRQSLAEDGSAVTWGVAEHMTIAHAAGVLVSSPDAFALVDGRVGVAEYKIVQPWNADRWPVGVLEVSTLADLDDASSMGRWPVSRQYVVQAMVHLLCTGLDFVDLFAVFAKDVELGHVVDGWDSPIAVEGTARLRIYNDPDTLAAVLHSIDSAHKEIIIDGREPIAHAPPPPWDASRDPLSGKRDATLEERDTLAEIAQLTAKSRATKDRLGHLRAGLRDGIADSGVKAIACESTAGKISASIAKSGRFTIRGL